MRKYRPLNTVQDGSDGNGGDGDDDAYVRVLRDEVRVYLNTRVPKYLKKDLDTLTLEIGGTLQENVEGLLKLALEAYYSAAHGETVSVDEARRRLRAVLAEL